MIEYLKIVEERKINMKFLDAEFVKGFIRMANDGWEQGWHERNGGNLSYRVKPEEVESVKENFAAKEVAADRNFCSKTGRRIFSCDRKWKIFP